MSKRNKYLNSDEEIKRRIIILKNRLSEVIGRLFMPSKYDDLEALDKEYHEIVEELKNV